MSVFKGIRLFLNGLHSIDKETAMILFQFKKQIKVSMKIRKQIHFYMKENQKKTTTKT